jgi:chromosome segregation ATPase
MYADHDHGGEYADLRHDHHGDYAAERHRHYDLERDGETAQREIRGLRDDLRELRSQLDDALARIRQLEAEHQADIQRENWELREAAEHGREPVYGPPDEEEEDR